MTMGDPMEVQIKDCLPILIGKLTAHINSGKLSAGDKRAAERGLQKAIDLEQELVPICRRVIDEIANLKPNRRRP